MQQDKLQRRKQREERQLARLTAMKQKGRHAWYFVILVGVIILVDWLDNFTTNVNSKMANDFLTEFFVNGKGYTMSQANAVYESANLITYVIGLLTPFYKALADKWGRKPLFVISTAGMAFGLLLIAVSRTFWGFMAGNVITYFFLSHDVQILYILEESPSDKRARIYSILKGIGALGAFFVPVMRATAMHNDTTLWRAVYLVPGLCGLAISVVVFFLVRETSVFIDDRTAYLLRPFEERIAEEQAAKQQKKTHPQKAGIINAIKYIFRDKQLRTLVIAKAIFDTAIIAMTKDTLMMGDFRLTTEQITQALFWYPVIYCAAVIVSGFVADKIGRKTTVVVAGATYVCAFVLFVLALNLGWSPIVVGIADGLFLGSYWIGRDYMEIISTEMVPTEIRASVVGAIALLMNISMALGLILVTVGSLFIPMWIVCLCVSVPCVSVAVVMLALKVKETKGVDYESIAAAE